MLVSDRDLDREEDEFEESWRLSDRSKRSVRSSMSTDINCQKELDW